jgi:hypothetical protein
MKAEYYFEERFIKTNKEPSHYDLNEKRFDAYDMIDFAQQFAESYARIQIEKDRENLKITIARNNYDIGAIDSTPITLD